MSAHLFPALPAWPKTMMNREVKSIFGPQNKVITYVGQGNVPSSMSDTQSDTRSVFRVIQNANPLARRDETFGPSEGFNKASELSGVVAARSTS